MISVFHTLMRPWNGLDDPSTPHAAEVCETSYNSSEWKWVEVVAEKPYLTSTRGAFGTKHYYCHYNVRTKNAYHSHDSSYIVALKCLVVFLSAPLFVATKIVLEASLFVFHDLSCLVIGHHFHHAHHDVVENKEGLGTALSEHGGQTLPDLCTLLFSRILPILRAIYYLPGLMVAALGGVFVDPYLGRHHIGRIERKMNDLAIWNTDIRIFLSKPESRTIPLVETKLFLMHSFQPRLVVGDSAYANFYRNVAVTEFASYQAMKDHQRPVIETTAEYSPRYKLNLPCLSLFLTLRKN